MIFVGKSFSGFFVENFEEMKGKKTPKGHARIESLGHGDAAFLIVSSSVRFQASLPTIQMESNLEAVEERKKSGDHHLGWC